MNTNNFKIFVEALEALPEEIKNNKVDMRSNFEPICGTAGCFAGLISIVANDIPELKKHYTSSIYSFSNWGMALHDFLGISLQAWAWENPTIWENTRGISVYSFNEAWGKSEDETLIHNDIIIHLRKALNNWIAFENKSNEHQYPTEQ
jgi:hypothetical protein